MCEALVVIGHRKGWIFGEGGLASLNRVVVPAGACQAASQRVQDHRVTGSKRSGPLQVRARLLEAAFDFVTVSTQIEENRVAQTLAQRITGERHRLLHVATPHRGIDVEINLGWVSVLHGSRWS